MPTATIHIGDALATLRTLPDASVHCCVTSPPYFGLRDYGEDGQMGLEATPAEYVAGMVAVFEEVRRVLRDDGTLWLNIGDSYAGSGKGAWSVTDVQKEVYVPTPGGAQTKCKTPGLKPKDLIGIPWRLAFALQDAGWYLRSDIIWAKGNPMPESVTDRPTKAHEYVFLLSKSARYFYDHEAVKEPVADSTVSRLSQPTLEEQEGSTRANGGAKTNGNMKAVGDASKRNRRTVWEINTRPFKQAHFAVFPPDLVEPCVKAGTSEKGCCPACGAPWERVVEKGEPVGVYEAKRDDSAVTLRNDAARHAGRVGTRPASTTGWEPTCDHAADPVPCTVLDPFNGAGTTGLVALALGRDYIGVELNPDYAAMAAERIAADAPMFNRVEVIGAHSEAA